MIVIMTLSNFEEIIILAPIGFLSPKSDSLIYLKQRAKLYNTREKYITRKKKKKGRKIIPKIVKLHSAATPKGSARSDQKILKISSLKSPFLHGCILLQGTLLYHKDYVYLVFWFSQCTDLGENVFHRMQQRILLL